MFDKKKKLFGDKKLFEFKKIKVIPFFHTRVRVRFIIIYK